MDGRSTPVFSKEDLLLLYLALPDEDAKLTLLASDLRAVGIDWTYLERMFSHWPSMEEAVRFWLAQAL